MVNSYARFYFWEQIEKIIRELRRKDITFIIKKNGNYFVLKEQDEADYYKKLCDKAIEHMENAQIRADEWVEHDKWRDFEKGKVDFEMPRKSAKPTLSKEEQIEQDIQKAKKRLNKLLK